MFKIKQKKRMETCKNLEIRFRELVNYKVQQTISIRSQKKDLQQKKYEINELIIQLKNAIKEIYNKKQECLTILKKYYAGKPKPFRIAYNELLHQLQDHRDSEEVFYYIAREIIESEVDTILYGPFGKPFKISSFGTTKPRTKTFHSLPNELKMKINKQRKSILNQVCMDNLKEIVNIFKNGPTIRLKPEFRRLYLQNDHLLYLINKMNTPICMNVLMTVPKFRNAYTNVLNGLGKFSNESLLYELYRQYKPRQALGNLNFGVNLIDRTHDLPIELQKKIALGYQTIYKSKVTKCKEIKQKLLNLLKRFTRTVKTKREFFDDLDDGFDNGHLKDTLRRYVKELIDNNCLEYLNSPFLNNAYNLWNKQNIDDFLYLILNGYRKDINKKKKRSLRRL